VARRRAKRLYEGHELQSREYSLPSGSAHVDISAPIFVLAADSGKSKTATIEFV